MASVEGVDRLARYLLGGAFAWYGGGSGHFVPVRRRNANAQARVVVLSLGQVPTTDIYLRLPLANRFGGLVSYVDVRSRDPDGLDLHPDTLVVIVRHLPRRWLRWLALHRDQCASIAYLIDDDIPSALAARELPFIYALKTAWRYTSTRRLLQAVCDQVWVSTTELARRCCAFAPSVLKPVYVPAEQQAVQTGDLVYFYHGTWAHRREIEWLVPVVRAVQEAVPEAWFEISGTERVRRLFRGIPRVKVVPPMPWPAYLAYAGTVRYQVGLAPCLDTPFNRARAHVKLFDITRLGAVGVYSDVMPYQNNIVHGETGWLCENSPSAWVSAICDLLTAPQRRASVYSAALAYCEATWRTVLPVELSE